MTSSDIARRANKSFTLFLCPVVLMIQLASRWHETWTVAIWHGAQIKVSLKHARDTRMHTWPWAMSIYHLRPPSSSVWISLLIFCSPSSIEKLQPFSTFRTPLILLVLCRLTPWYSTPMIVIQIIYNSLYCTCARLYINDHTISSSWRNHSVTRVYVQI